MAKKHGLAILLGLGKEKPGAGIDGDEGLSASGDELADILGVAPDKRAAFKSALHNYVTQCAAAGDSYDDEGAEASDEM